MIIAFFAMMAFQDAPIEPATRADLDAVLADYKVAKFDVAIGTDGKLTCTSDRKVASGQLSVQTCLAANSCVMQGKTDRAALTACVDAERGDIAKDYRRDWLKSHPK